MDPRRVLTFRSVAHRRSFSDAARALSLSQPAVSNQVAALERELGASLLQRRPGGLELTGEGAIVLEHADVIADRLELAAAQVAAAVQGRRALLRIGAFPTALASLVPAVVQRLRQDYPQLRVTFDEGAAGELSAKLHAGELDVAIVFTDVGAEVPAARAHHLLRERFMVALSPQHPLARKRAVALADLRDADWSVALTDGVIVRACREAGFEPRIVSITRDQLAINSLIRRGLAVTLVPELLADAFGQLALRPIAGSTLARDVYALLPPGGLHALAPELLVALDEIVAGLTGAA